MTPDLEKCEKADPQRCFAYTGKSGNTVYLTVPSPAVKPFKPKVFDNFSYLVSGSESFICTVSGNGQDYHASKTWPEFHFETHRISQASLQLSRDTQPLGKHVGKRRQVMAVAGAIMGFMSMGAAMAWSATAVPSIRKSNELGPISVSQDTWMHSLMTLGAAVGSPIAGLCIEKLGRRFTIVATAFPLLLASAMMGFAQNVSMIYCGRFLTGLCVGCYTISAPVFIAEISDKQVRGAFATGLIIMLNVGLLFIYIVGTFASWRIQSLAVGITPWVGAILLLFVHESPRFLLNREKYDLAMKSLVWYRGARFPKDVEEELQEILHSVEEEKQRVHHWKSALVSKPLLKPVGICLGLVFFQQFSGIDAIKGYSVDIFTSSGAQLDENWCTNILGVVDIATCAFASHVVDKYGRRLLLVLSGSIMGFALCTLGGFFCVKRFLYEGETPLSLSWWPITSLILYSIGFCLGFGPMIWILMGELLPSRIKGIATGFVVTAKWLLGFVATKLFMDFIDLMGEDGGYFILAIICITGAVYVHIALPETKKKSLDEIQLAFKSKRKRIGSNRHISTSTI